MTQQVILVGLMGSGKSILGQHLAAQVNFSAAFIDLDELIVEQSGKCIPDIFADEGEPAFRKVESQCLASTLASVQSQIIATGGGAILSAKNRAIMKEKSVVIWLDASPEVLANRVAGDANRPLLNDIDPLVKMRDLSQARKPMYEAIADLRIDTEIDSEQEAVAKMITFLSDCGT